MRRGAVTVAFCGLATVWLSCRETVLLPATVGGATGGSSGGDAGGMIGSVGGFPVGNGGRGGAQATGGNLGGGGRVAGGGTTGGTMGGGGRGGNCRSPQNVSVEFYPAQVLILLEKSASMATKFGPSDNRLAVVQQTLKQLVDRNQSAVYFGYREFPGASLCTSNDGCCGVGGVLIPPSLTSGPDVEQALTCASTSCVSTIDARPIDAALDSASRVFDDRNSYKGERNVLLIADGEPFCPAVTGDQCEGAAIKRSQLENAGAKVTVLAVGPDVQAGGCLAVSIANANAGRPLLRATTPNELSTELGTIVKSAARAVCTLTIRNLQGVDTKTLTVALKGQSIEASPDSGWTLLPGSPGKIQLNGEACNRMQQGVQIADVEVQACSPQQQQQPQAR